ncbi:hypothetical protein [Butyrivibrio sp. AE3003]|uniref:hypothetical protein n=1 Tax=Butyrivibrio sp. AE3003 TaxID=1496721 RepID=UPI000479BBAA|nr:hypothetical protein [Butyrivibrio sp. AE3003]
MEGMDTQDILSEQDLSNANIDDLLAAMKAEESSAGFLREDVGTATDVGNAAAIDDAPIDVLNAIADAAPGSQDILDTDAAIAEALEGIAADVQAEEKPVETLGEGESIDIEPIEELLDTEETAEEVTDEAVDEVKEAEPAVDVDAMLAAMAEAETATDVDAMLASMAQADASGNAESEEVNLSEEEAAIMDNLEALAAEIPEVDNAAEVPITETADTGITEAPITEITENMSAEIPITEATEPMPEFSEVILDEPVIEDKLETQEIPDIEEAIPEAPVAEDAFLGEVVAKEAANVESGLPDPAEMDALMDAMKEPESDQTITEDIGGDMSADEMNNLDEVLNAEVDALTEAVVEEAATSASDMTMADAVSGDANQIESFLESNGYEYTAVKNGAETIFILKTSENNALAITYADGEFQSLEPGFSKEDQRGYGDILTAYVEETITSGGQFEIKRHKGSTLV